MGDWRPWTEKDFFNAAIVSTLVSVISWESFFISLYYDWIFADLDRFWFAIAGVAFTFIAVCFWIAYNQTQLRSKRFRVWKILLIVLFFTIAMLVFFWGITTF